MYKIEVLAVLNLCLLFHSFQAQGIRYNISLHQIQGQSKGCASNDEIQTARRNITQDVKQIIRERVLSTCNRFLLTDPIAPSGLYNITDSTTGNRVQIYCEMDGSRWEGTGGWYRIAYLDMTDPSQSCPRTLASIINPVRSCGRRSSSGCDSVVYASHGIPYTQICGRLVGYQYGSTEAFWYYNHRSGVTIDSPFVDGGVTITRGSNPRKHIWSFPCGETQVKTTTHDCPCNNGNEAVLVPPWVGEDYFCDSGSMDQSPGRWYTSDPLWDGAGCGSTTSCCEFNSPPWFCKQLDEPTSDDVEIRLCGDEGPSNENTPLEIIEIYVQ